MLILEFNTEIGAEACLSAINSLAESYCAGKGYTLFDNNGDNEIVGKVNGNDAPNNQRTTTWDAVRESPDNTYYFTSLSNNTSFTNWVQLLDDSGFTAIGVEIEYPSEWDEE